MLFPDVNAIKKWQQKAAVLRRQMPDTRFVVSDYLEQLATYQRRKVGVDIGMWCMGKSLWTNGD